MVESKAEDGFQPDIDGITAAVRENTKAILINSPNNPTGAIYTNESLEALAKLKPRKAKAPVARHDPKHIKLARDLRDRFLDQVNGDASLLLPSAKYEVARALPAGTAPAPFIEVKALPEAA